MNIGVMTLSYNRPQLLGRAIYCFLQQTHPSCKMFVLDDGGQFDRCEHETWKLVSVPARYPTLGDKRNACISMLADWWPEMEAVAIMDDDDVYWPHHLAAIETALQSRPWAQPRIVYESADAETLKRCLSCSLIGRRKDEPAYGGSWAYRLDAFRAAGGYRSTDVCDDVFVADALLGRCGPSADTICKRFSEPSYWYYREGGKHLSDLGDAFWGKRGQEEVEFVGQPQVGWNGPDFYAMPVIPGVHPRPWEDPALERSKTGLFVARAMK